jgi:hypothetical protein
VDENLLHTRLVCHGIGNSSDFALSILKRLLPLSISSIFMLGFGAYIISITS